MSAKSRVLKPRVLMPVELMGRKHLRTIYSLYLQGNSVESIILFMRVRHNIAFEPEEINNYIDELNQAYL